ncbi:MAG: septum site-determining protein MinC [Leptothrix sp. (in: b-proteobacteria)]
MALVSPAVACFDLKSTAWTLTTLQLRTADLAELEQALDQRYGDTPGLFDDDPVAIDLGALREADAEIDFPALYALLRHHGMLPIAVLDGSAAQTVAAREVGLAEAMDAAPRHAAPAEATPALDPVEPEPTPADALDTHPMPFGERAPDNVPTLVIDTPLRSGQQVYARGGDLVVLALVSHGAEVIADGSIHVYAPLRGRAIAGAKGNSAARIFSTCLEAQLVSIAGTYRTTETPLPANVLGKPAQVRMDGERLVIEPLKS